MSPRAYRHRAPLALALGLLGCSEFNPRGFDVDYPSNRPAPVLSVAERVAGQTFEAEPALVALVPVSPARGVTVFSVPEGRRLWQNSTALDARPAFASGALVSHSGRQVLAWDARTGAQRFVLSDNNYQLIGASGDGRSIALALGPGGLNRRRGTLLAVDAQSGAVRFSRDVEQPLGHPTIADNFLLVPWSSQYLSVFDVGRNEEFARLRSAEDIFAHAWREGNVLYFGARTLYRLGPDSARAQRDPAHTFRLEREDLPGNPQLTMDGYMNAMAGTNARERVTTSWRFDPAQPGVQLTDGTLYLLFHRVVFATEAATGAVRWAWTAPNDLAGVQPTRGGFFAVDERGGMFFLDARAGNVRWHADAGMRAAQAVVQVPLDFAPPASSDSEAAQPAATTLLVAAGGTDTRMLPARLYATRALGTMRGPEATRALLELASQREYPQELLTAANEALGRRTEGLDPLLAALGTHFHFIRGTPAPPVGAIARAMGATRERRAVPLLVAQLSDPGTPLADLPDVVEALRAIADASAVPALLDFLRLYHSDDGAVPGVDGSDPVNDRSITDQDAVNLALGTAAQAVVQLGSPSDRRWLAAFLTDTNTVGGARTRVEAAVGGVQQAPSVAASAGGTAGASGGQPAIVDANLPPPRLLPEQITQAFAAVRDPMLACLNALSSRPSQVRLTFFYDATGHISNLAVTPPTLSSCVTPVAQTVTLPRSQVGRDIGTYYLLGGPL